MLLGLCTLQSSESLESLAPTLLSDNHVPSVFRRYLRARLQHLTQGTGGLILNSKEPFSWFALPTRTRFSDEDTP
jgi:hypothetical protein